jgi:hypothetical protein
MYRVSRGHWIGLGVAFVLACRPAVEEAPVPELQANYAGCFLYWEAPI